MQLASSLPVFLLFSLALAWPGGYSLGALLLFVISLVALTRWRPRLDRLDLLLIAVFGSYTIVCVLTGLLHDDPTRRYDVPMRFALAIVPLLFLRRVAPRPWALWGGAALGALAAACVALWQISLGGALRAGGAVNPIQYGNISIALGLLCVAGLAWVRQDKPGKTWHLLLGAGAAAGMLASLLTQSRGSWLALPLCLPVLACCPPWDASLKKGLFGLALALAVLGGLLAFSPDSAFKRRFTDASAELDAYRQGGKADNAVGGRLEMWRTSWIIFTEKPWLGSGWNGYEQRKREMVQRQQAHPYILEHVHAHNDFLDAMAKRGVVGLMATLAIYLFPVVAFVRMVRNGPAQGRPYALAGAMMAMSWIGFGLTDAFLVHNNGGLLYALSVAILWSMARAQPAPAR